MQTANFMATLMGELSVAQVLTTLGISGGSLVAALVAFWKFFISNKLTAFKLNDDSHFRYRQLEEQRRDNFQKEVMARLTEMKVENDDLRKKLFESEDHRLELMRKIGELQIEISELKSEIVRLTSELIHLRGVQPHAAHG